MLCHGQAQTVLLPHDFLLFRVLGGNSRDHHNNLGILDLELGPDANAVVRNAQSSCFEGLVDQV